MSKLAAVAGTGLGAAAKAGAARALAAVFRVQVGGGLHIKPLALLLTGISIESLGEVDAGKGVVGRTARLRQLLEQLQEVVQDVEGLQGEKGALVLIARKLQAQASNARQCGVCMATVLSARFVR